MRRFIIRGSGSGEKHSSLPDAWAALEVAVTKLGLSKDDYPHRFVITDTYDTDPAGHRTKPIARSTILLGIAMDEYAIDDAHDTYQDGYGFCDLHRVVNNEWGSIRFASQSDY